MKKKSNIKQIIVHYVTCISISLGVILTVILIITSLASTTSVLLDNLEIVARVSSQNISSNLHLLADRMDNLSQEEILANPTVADKTKQQLLDEKKKRIEFVWLAAYDLNGSKLYGDSLAPVSIGDDKVFEYLIRTDNITIGEPFYENEIWQLVIGVPLRNEGETYAYLMGSYKYDLLNDVLSNINIGARGMAFIVNEDGTIIADKDMSNMENHDNIYDIYGSTKNSKVFDAMLNFQTNSDSVFLGWKQHYIAYSPVAGTNWTFFIAAPGMDFMQILFVSIILSVVFIALLQVLVRKLIVKVADKISGSLSLATDRLSLLSSGNLKDEVVLADGNTEAEVLTSALAETISSLGQYIDDITTYLGFLSDGDYSQEVNDTFRGDFIAISDALSSITASLNDTMHHINQASLAVNANSSETSAYAGKLYDGYKEQTEALDRLRNSVRVITTKTDQIDENAKHVKQSADVAELRVEEGRKQMDDMLSTMNSIYQNMQEIITISHLIEDISSETSLLALNASIEAARAGEAGKGFAIVAQQIGVLSEQTANALSKTGEIIDQANISIEQGMKTVKDTAESFQNVKNATSEFSIISDNMIHITTQQKEAIDMVINEVRTVVDIADTNQNLARETDDIAARSLQQAEELKQIVSAVKLREV